ncbi:uncharacterized protein [Argopecten irradians]|uniref:uncharacterized protein n=1 Tax=Argopecten irradians TaxID=31199 RepID=UPI00371FF6C6
MQRYQTDVRARFGMEGFHCLPEYEKALHRPVVMDGPGAYKKPCVLCEVTKARTKSGWYIYSRYKCSQCDVALCTGSRGCFTTYHNNYMGMLQHITASQNVG